MANDRRGMSSVEAFSSLLYELIAMNKLSGSRVARVTESATHALHDPDGLSKVMLKAHMRAPPQNKLVSVSYTHLRAHETS